MCLNYDVINDFLKATSIHFDGTPFQSSFFFKMRGWLACAGRRRRRRGAGHWDGERTARLKGNFAASCLRTKDADE